MRKKLIAGNWKMNGSLAANQALVQGILAELGQPGCEVLVCPPAVYLAQLADLLAGSPVLLGGQDVSQHEAGAYTGDVSAAMLRELGASHVIVGHSERRAYQGETDLQVAAKARSALAAGLVPVVCVGETLAEREQGLTGFIVQRQLAAVLQVCGTQAQSMVVAYEPVWAIGTGQTATPEQAQQVHAALRAQLAQAGLDAGQLRILYGGSMNAGNAASLLAQPDIDGGLIGGAALKAADFLNIVQAASAAGPSADN